MNWPTLYFSFTVKG